MFAMMPHYAYLPQNIVVPTMLERNFFPTGASALEAAAQANEQSAQIQAERVASLEVFRQNTRQRVAEAAAAKRENKLKKMAILKDQVESALLHITTDVAQPTPLQLEVEKLEDGVQAASNALLAYSQRAPVVASAPSDQVQSKVLARLRDPASAQNKPLPQQPFWARGQAANLKFSKHEEAQVVEAVRKWKMEEDRNHAHEVAKNRQAELVTDSGVPAKLLQLPAHLQAVAAEIEAAKLKEKENKPRNRTKSPAAKAVVKSPRVIKTPLALTSAVKRPQSARPTSTMRKAERPKTPAAPTPAPAAAEKLSTPAKLGSVRRPNTARAAMHTPIASSMTSPYVHHAMAVAAKAALFEKQTETESLYAQLEQRWREDQDLAEQRRQHDERLAVYERVETARLASHRRTHLRATARFRAAVRHKLIERLEALGVSMPPLCLCGLTVYSVDTTGCAQNCVFYKNPAAFQKAVEDIYASMTA